MICKAPARVGPSPANPPLAMRTITTLLIANLALLSATNGQHLSENIFKHPDDAPVTARFKSPCTPDCLARAPISLSASYSGLYPGSKYDVTLIVQQGLDVVHMTSQQVFKTERRARSVFHHSAQLCDTPHSPDWTLLCWHIRLRSVCRSQ